MPVHNMEVSGFSASKFYVLLSPVICDYFLQVEFTIIFPKYKCGSRKTFAQSAAVYSVITFLSEKLSPMLRSTTEF